MTDTKSMREVAEAKIARGERFMSVNASALVEVLDELDSLRGTHPARKVALTPYAFDGCHGARDGECSWEKCPQLRDGEPEASGRHCPLDTEPGR